MPEPAAELPFAIVRPEMAIIPEVILKMRKFGVPVATLRCTVNRFAPGPLIIRAAVRVNR
jgi:hypothetical protein